MRSYVCEDAEVTKRLKALQEQKRNICYDRIYPRPSGDCWCKILKEPGTPDLSCPPPAP